MSINIHLKIRQYMPMILLLAGLSSTAMIGQTVHAETLAATSQESSTLFNIKTPERGMTMRQVRQTFGKPLHISYSKGRVKANWPRITLWDYKHFTVYFERKTVLHSVSKSTH